MKKLLCIASLFICSIVFAQETASANSGVFDFKTETIDYGAVNKNTDGNRTFTFKNTGDSPIIITSVKGSCGCTVATKPSKPIMPNETAVIGVKYDTKRVGPFSKTITVVSNASEKSKVLRIKGSITDTSQLASN
ncbi:MAG: hypothetical protein COA88_02530 [Kordia sp.]|nr:MAG: hypothetical protein COA88_02530 [Kordia sp.]